MSIVSRPRLESAAGRSLSANRRLLFLAVIVLVGLTSFAIGFLVDQARVMTKANESELVLLVRMMAMIKLGMVAGAAWLLDWRLQWACGPQLALGYALAVALMASAPGLIWFMTAALVASVLFHAGLLLALLLGWRDGRSAFKSAN